MRARMLAAVVVLHFLFSLPIARLPLASAAQAQGNLSLVIRPDSKVVVPATLNAVAQHDAVAGNNAVASGNVAVQFELPVNTRIRLAPGTSAHLQIETMANPFQSLPGFRSGELIIDGISQPLTVGRQTIVQLNQSGTFQNSVVLRMTGTDPFSSGTLPVQLTLQSQDGLINWTGQTLLTWTAPAP